MTKSLFVPAGRLGRSEVVEGEIASGSGPSLRLGRPAGEGPMRGHLHHHALRNLTAERLGMRLQRLRGALVELLTSKAPDLR